ncbi:MAG TPA: glycosyltransferase [Acidimicrobiales bacterium]|nr:glycosyltransferase [Acidimicrobiales bacterium]
MPGARPVIDAVIPARNEEPTVASVVEACLACRYVRQVVVVDDGSTDDTATRAAAAGAKVVRRGPLADGSGGPSLAFERSQGSKAHAMEAGVEASDAEAILFVDADLIGLTAAHLDAICQPYVEGRAVMSLGTFDYRWLNPLVVRLPPTTGERIVPRWVFNAVPPSKRDGYTIEVMINEVIAEGRCSTTARVMKGVTHRTKRQKFGWPDGWRRTWQMFWDMVGVLRTVRARSYWFYLRDLRVEG